MCGMGLPGAGDAMDSPAEREPLDLDLSLDLDDSGSSSSSIDLSFDLGSGNEGGLDFSSGLDADFGSAAGVSGNKAGMSINLETGSDDDFGIDLGNSGNIDISGDFSGVDSSSIELDISIEPEATPMSFDFDDGSSDAATTTAAAADDEDPFAAPDGFEISLDADTDQTGNTAEDFAIASESDDFSNWLRDRGKF